MPRYNHMVILAFGVVSEHPEGEDITHEMLKDALQKRIVDMDSEQTWEEACLPIEDTYMEQ